MRAHLFVVLDSRVEVSALLPVMLIEARVRPRRRRRRRVRTQAREGRESMHVFPILPSRSSRGENSVNSSFVRREVSVSLAPPQALDS